MPTPHRKQTPTPSASRDQPIRFPPAKVGYDEDDYGERGATLLFTGLFGTIPGTQTEPIPLQARQ